MEVALTYRSLMGFRRYLQRKLNLIEWSFISKSETPKRSGPWSFELLNMAAPTNYLVI